MEGSQHQACLTKCVDPRESRGSHGRGQDQIIEGTECDPDRQEIYKVAAQFKSPTNTCNADDSGFVDLYPSLEVDDEVWPIRREGFLQCHNLTSGVCSTPNRGSIQDHTLTRLDITNSSPIQVRNFQVPPLTLRPYFIPQGDAPKLNFDQPKIIFNTVFDNIVSSQCPGLNCQDYHSNRLLGEYSKLVTSKETDSEQSPNSELTRGHSTIASLLNSRPLNLFHTSQRNPGLNAINDGTVARVKGGSITNESTIGCNFTSKLGEENCKENLNAKTTNDNTIPSERDTLDCQKSVGYQFVDGCKHEYSLSGVSDESEDALGVDLNNNNLLVQKYSDISDACASDTETSIETSSSDEDLPKVKEITIKSSHKNKRKARYPRRSAVKGDPRFKGVTMWLQTSFSKGHSSLHISAFYSNVKVVPPRRRSSDSESRCCTPQYPSDHDDTTPSYSHKDSHVSVKTCASCKTRRTPLWRDAEDGTPLCNACGIRYKKYRLRCSKCWHIPKKEVKTYPNCPVCGASLRFSFHKKSW